MLSVFCDYSGKVKTEGKKTTENLTEKYKIEIKILDNSGRDSSNPVLDLISSDGSTVDAN